MASLLSPTLPPSLASNALITDSPTRHRTLASSASGDVALERSSTDNTTITSPTQQHYRKPLPPSHPLRSNTVFSRHRRLNQASSSSDVKLPPLQAGDSGGSRVAASRTNDDDADSGGFELLPAAVADVLHQPASRRLFSSTSADTLAPAFNSRHSFATAKSVLSQPHAANSTPQSVVDTMASTFASQLSLDSAHIRNQVLQPYLSQILQHLPTKVLAQMLARYNEVTAFRSLNNDILTSIYQFLPARDMLRCCTVNKSWYLQSLHPLAWQHKTVALRYFDAESLDIILNRIKYVWHLSLKEVHFTSQLCTSISHLSQLRSLHIIASQPICTFEVTPLQRLEHLQRVTFNMHTNATINLLQPLKQLTSIELSAVLATDVALQGIASSLSNLQSLVLTSCNGFITDAGIAHLQELPELHTFKCYQLTGITHEALLHLSRCSSISTLALQSCPASLAVGVPHLAKLPKLTSLNLDGLIIHDAEMKALAAKLSKTLQSLTVNTRELTTVGLTALATMQSLIDLTVDALVPHDTHLIVRLQQLQQLTIRYSYIRSENCFQLSRLPQLAAVTLDECFMVCDAGIRHFCTNSQSLRKLLIKQCPLVTKRGVQQARSKAPAVRIVRPTLTVA